MKTTRNIVLASAALTGLAVFLWNRMAGKRSASQMTDAQPQERSRHLNPVFSKMKQHVQGNV